METAHQAHRTSGSEQNVRIYPAGTIIIEEDTPDDGCIYILSSGTLGVYREGRQVREMSGSGLLFGEMATILNSKRTATIRALTECRIRVYTGGLARIISQFPTITMKIIVALAERVQDLTDAAVEGRLALDLAADDAVQPSDPNVSGPFRIVHH
jgi:CRP-like cAMP-binding protein